MLPSSTDLLVLNGLRLKGFVETAPLGMFLDMPYVDVERRLQEAAEKGHTLYRDGGRSGWSLTADGRREHDRLLAAELDSVNRRADMEAVYREFLDLNRQMLEICTRWQVTDQENQVLNDHLNEAYDQAVIAELKEIDFAVQPMCAVLGSWFGRFSSYGPRFSLALKKLSEGHNDWFTKPTIDSYHTVWFELHEDLLVTLGIDRASERV
ncbi:MAG: transcriptional regulator [Acidimicrobiales bacterium]